MKKFLKIHSFTVLTVSCLLLAACETTPSKPEVAPTPVPKEAPPPPPVVPVEAPPSVPTLSIEALLLRDGVALYNNGNFSDAIKKLNSTEIWAGNKDKAVQVQAAKYIAFSYCVTNRAALCRQQFERALKIDPSFELAAGEKGHPLWGPVFLKAKRGK